MSRARAVSGAVALEGYAAVLRSAGDEKRATELEARAAAIRAEKGGHSASASNDGSAAGSATG